MRGHSAVPSLDLTIMIPARNEAESIALAVDSAHLALEDLRSRSIIGTGEILIVEGGSTDGTARILRTAKESIPELVVVPQRGGPGMGNAVWTGLCRAVGQLVFYTDADLPVSLEVLPSVVELQRATGADMVVGYRRSRRHESRRRRCYGWAYNELVRLVLGVRSRDVNFAAKLFTSEAISQLEARSSGILIDAELIASAQRRGMSIEEVAMDYEPRRFGESSTSSRRHILQLLREMMVLRSEISGRGGL